MNNFIEYFYDIKVDRVSNEGKYYFFIYNGYMYRLYIYDMNINLNELIDINRQLIRTTLMSEVIFNRNNDIISSYNNVNYILLRLYSNINKKITLEEINYLARPLQYEKKSIDWGGLWSNKIDYLEDLISENGKNYPLIVDTFNYFVGMAENAIEYFNSINLIKHKTLVVSHRTLRINDMVDDLYNPLNIVYDYRVRDVAEYIKNSFFNSNYNILYELNIYLKNNNLSLTEVKLLISRLLYPSFYFDMYSDILVDNKEENILFDIISKVDEYECYLNEIIHFFKLSYNIDEINWLKKRRT